MRTPPFYYLYIIQFSWLFVNIWVYAGHAVNNVFLKRIYAN